MRTSNLIKRGICLLTLLAMLVVGELLSIFALRPISYATYFNHDIQTLQKDKADVELVFIGASRVYRSFVPEIFEEKLQMDTVINAGSSSQQISGSYYLLKELLQGFDPEYVVLGVTGDALCHPYYAQANMIVLDRLNGLNKLQYIFDVIEPRDWTNAFLESYRFRNNLKLESIKENIIEKKQLRELSYKDDTSDREYYADTGFVYSKAGFVAGNVSIRDPIEVYPVMNNSELEYLNKIVNLCEKENIDLFLVTGPTTMMRIYNSEVYQFCHEWYLDYASKNGLVYHNLNYLKGREAFLPDTLMHDYNHVNGEGAGVVSELYAEILSKTMAGGKTDEYFYASFEQLSQDVNRVVAVGVESVTVENGIAEILLTSLHNKDVDPYYQISGSTNGENYELLIDWTQDSKFTLDVSEYENLTLMLRAKTGQESEVEAFKSFKLK